MSDPETNPPETEPTTPKESEPTTTPEPPKAEADDKSLVSKEPDDKSEPEPFEEVTPEALKEALPEGAEVDDQGLNDFAELVNKHHLPEEVRKDLINLQNGLAERAAESLSQAWEQMQEEWRTETMKHPDLGARESEVNASIQATHQMVSEVMGEDATKVFEALSLTGAGNHPDVVRFLAKLAKERGEGSPTPASASPPPQDLASRMFPNQGSG